MCMYYLCGRLFDSHIHFHLRTNIYSLNICCKKWLENRRMSLNTKSYNVATHRRIQVYIWDNATFYLPICTGSASITYFFNLLINKSCVRLNIPRVKMMYSKTPMIPFNAMPSGIHVHGALIHVVKRCGLWVVFQEVNEF